MRLMGLLCVVLLACLATATADHPQPAYRIQTCQECIDSGYGWCPIRRACGGFANRECFGGNDERDFARPRVTVVTDHDMAALEDDSVARILLAYSSKTTAGGVLAVFEEAALESQHDMVGATVGTPKHLSVDLALNKGLRRQMDLSDGDLPRLLVYPRRPADGAEAPAPSVYTGPWRTDALIPYLVTAASVRIPDMDDMVGRFVESLLHVLMGSASAEEAQADMDLILEDARAMNETVDPSKAAVADYYVSTMETIVGNPGGAMVWLSTTVNGLKRDGIVSDELEVLQVFAAAMMG